MFDERVIVYVRNLLTGVATSDASFSVFFLEIGRFTVVIVVVSRCVLHLGAVGVTDAVMVRLDVPQCARRHAVT